MMPRRRSMRWLVRGVALFVSLLLAAGIAMYALLAGSLAKLDGELIFAGLTGPVEIGRDRLGIAVIRGYALNDVIFAQGFVHGQERFFQMDLTRRHAAGTLAELVGPLAIESDKRMRAFDFAAIADHVFHHLSADQRHLLEQYAAGVNAGLDDLSVRPPEYLVLRSRPEPWEARDCVLVMLSMFDLLHINAPIKRNVGVMHDTMPAELVDFLTPEVSRFDTLLIEPPGEPEEPETGSAIPGPEVIDLRRRNATESGTDLSDAASVSSHSNNFSSFLRRGESSSTQRNVRIGDQRVSWNPPCAGMTETPPGSNTWAVDGSRTADGRAILANDPHLPLSVPNTWFRVQLEWAAPGMTADHASRLVGVSIPGTPGVIIGSNGHVAWSATNTQGDFQDWVIIESDPDNPDHYLTADGHERFRIVEHTIRVRGSESVTTTVRHTRWGPVVDNDHRGRPLALMWTALLADHITLDIYDVMDAKSLGEAVGAARRWWGPSQNMLIVDADGAIAWVMTGFLPRREGGDGRFPVPSTTPDFGWAGALDESLRPVVIHPADGFLVAANHRTLPLDRARLIGRTWADPIRAWRIREMIADQMGLAEPDMLTVQLDVRSPLYDFYRDLLVETIGDNDKRAPLMGMRRLVEQWNGLAERESEAYLMLTEFRRALVRTLIDSLTEPARQQYPEFRYRWLMAEEPIRRLLEERPEHLLPARFESWDELIIDAAETAARRSSLAETNAPNTWGDHNRLAMHHPLSPALPGWIARRLDMPAAQLDGDRVTVRVASPRFGVSMRMVVSPGREEDGIMHMPGGQSGHFLSPFYHAGHDEWLVGTPTPLLAGEIIHRLTLRP